MKHTKFENPDIRQAYYKFPKSMQTKMLEVREIIFEIAKNNKIEKINEILKWGDPIYQTSRSKNGTPIKIIYKKSMETNFSLSIISTTNLIEKFKQTYPKTFYFNGDREVIINTNKKIPRKEIYYFIELALTYKEKNKKK